MKKYIFTALLLLICLIGFAQTSLNLRGKWYGRKNGTDYTVYQKGDSIWIQYFDTEKGYTRTTFEGVISGDKIFGKKFHVSFGTDSYKDDDGNTCTMCNGNDFKADAYLIIEGKYLWLYVRTATRSYGGRSCCNISYGDYAYWWGLYKSD